MLCALLLSFVTAAPDPGMDCLNAWNQRLRDAKTISGTFSIKGPGVDETMTFQLARPNLAKVTGGKVEVFSDGQTQVAYVKSANKFGQRKAGRRIPAMTDTALGMEALFGKESNFEYKGYQEKGDLILVTMRHKDERLTVIGERAGISGGFEMTYSFIKASKTLQGFDLQAPEGVIKGVYQNLIFDSKMAKESFAYKLPPDAKPFEKGVTGDALLPVGSSAPDLLLKNTNGETVRLSDFVKTRKATLINFWFYGCGGCMIEFPNISRLHLKLAPKGFGVLGIDPLDDPKVAANYHSKGGFSFHSLVSKGSGIAPEKLYKVQAYPTNYILGPDMKILDGFIGEDEDRLLDALEKQGIKVESIGL